MDNLLDCLQDISKLNVIYTISILATARSFKLDDLISLIKNHMMNLSIAIPSNLYTETTEEAILDNYHQANVVKASLPIRIARRLALISDNFVVYLQNQFNDHTATSIASLSVVIIVVSIIFCVIISWVREEERRIKEQYKKLNRGSSQSYIGILGANRKLLSPLEQSQAQLFDRVTANNSICHARTTNHSDHNISGSFAYHTIGRIEGSHQAAIGSGGSCSSSSCAQALTSASPTSRYASSFLASGAGGSSTISGVIRSDSHKLHLIELRRETYFGLVRLLKPGCITIVLLCDSQSKCKLLSKFYQCVYPYRKIKTLQFAFLLIEKNLSWYEGLLKLALSEKRDLNINPINCIGTVLALNGFKKSFSVYHASDIRCDPDDHLLLLEETLLDGLGYWLEKLFAGKVNRYYVKYWPERMR